MHRPITVAIAISAAIHIAMFALVDWLIGEWGEPSLSDPVLVVSLHQSPTADGSSAAEQFSRSKSIKVSSRQANTADRSETSIDDKEKSNDLTPPPATAGPGSDHASGPARSAVRSDAKSTGETSARGADASAMRGQFVPTVTASTPTTVSPSFSVVPVSPAQETMLEKKFAEWSEDFYSMPDPATDLAWRHDGREYRATFTRQAAHDDLGIERVTVLVSTEENGKRLSTEMRMKRLAFSHYAQFVNRWDRDVQLHNDELDGRFHSNTVINLAPSRKIKPRFHGKVTTSANRINFAQSRTHARRDQIFLGGLQTRVTTIRLPEHSVPFPGDADVSENRIHRFAKDARITFYEDGSYGWQTIGSASRHRHAAVGAKSYYLLAARKVKLFVKGTVDGKVLVHSPERIVIEGDLVYDQDPRETPESDDYLGLVSDKYVDVAGPDVTGSGDLIIHAAIYARRRFVVRGYRSRHNALLNIFGSLTAGSLSATEPRFFTRVQYDQRLEALRPPRFPMTDRYAVEAWEPAWKVEPAATAREDDTAGDFRVQ